MKFVLRAPRCELKELYGSPAETTNTPQSHHTVGAQDGVSPQRPLDRKREKTVVKGCSEVIQVIDEKVRVGPD